MQQVKRQRKRTTRRKRKGLMDIDTQVNRALIKRSEKHWSDAFEEDNTLSATWEWGLLNGIAIGDNYNSRHGDAITMLKLRLKYNLVRLVDSASSDTARVVVVHDNQANGAAPTGATVFAADSYNKFQNHGYRQRYTVLYDRMFFLGFKDVTNKYAGGPIGFARKVNINIPKKLSTVRYIGDDALIASIGSGSLYIGFCSKVAAQSNISYSSRLVYTDN